MLSMTQSLKRLYSSDVDDQPDPKRLKHSSKDKMSASDDSDDNGDDSDAALKPAERARINHVLDSSKATAEMTQLAEFFNSLWSKKLPDSKLKDKSEKYLRPVSETLATPRNNPEI